MNWVLDRMFGPMINAIVAWSPWLWIIACALLALYLFVALPLAFKRWWQVIAAAAASGFVLLLVMQHFAGVAKLRAENDQLQTDNQKLSERVDALDTSINNHTDAVQIIEVRQREIRTEIREARQGLDSGTIKEEVQNDSVQAAADLSDRWNRLGRMSDDATASFGRATPSAAGARAD